MKLPALLLAPALLLLATGCANRETYTWNDTEGVVFLEAGHPNGGDFKSVSILLDNDSAPLHTRMSSPSLGQNVSVAVEPGRPFQVKGKLHIHRMEFEGKGNGSMVTRY